MNKPHVLMDKAQSRVLSVLCRSEAQGMAIDRCLTFMVRGMEAGQNLDEGGLAATIVSQQRVDGSGADVNVYVPQGSNTWEGLG
jgi:hypothetical protein